MEKTGKEMPESPRSVFLGTFSEHGFALPDADDNISGPLSREGLSDLPLLRTLSVIVKACVRYFLTNFHFSPNNSHSKAMKDVFYFI